jgi:hypothetical protein
MTSRMASRMTSRLKGNMKWRLKSRTGRRLVVAQRRDGGGQAARVHLAGARQTAPRPLPRLLSKARVTAFLFLVSPYCSVASV